MCRRTGLSRKKDLGVLFTRRGIHDVWSFPEVPPYQEWTEERLGEKSSHEVDTRETGAIFILKIELASTHRRMGSETDRHFLA